MGKKSKHVEFELENFFKFVACMISAQKTKHLDATTTFTYSRANTPLSQSDLECAYYLSYFINQYMMLHHIILMQQEPIRTSFCYKCTTFIMGKESDKKIIHQQVFARLSR